MCEKETLTKGGYQQPLLYSDSTGSLEEVRRDSTNLGGLCSTLLG